MTLKSFMLAGALIAVGACPCVGWAQVWDQSTAKPMVSGQDPDEEMDSQTGGFAKPYQFERESNGYDPEGVEYKENQAEDFQIVFISSLPFSALASFGVTGLLSLATEGSFQVGGNYFLPFLGLIAAGSTTVACVSVLTNKYPPPDSTTYVEGRSQSSPLVFSVPLIGAEF